MKKKIKGRELSRKRNQRRALLKTLAASLILKEKIATTRAKAKEVVPVVEKAITLCKKQNLSSRRRLMAILPERAVKKLMEVLGPRYLTRQGGYTRILKTENRLSDNAQMAIIEFIK